MAYYYVKSGLGTRTTGSSTKQTGAFGSTGLEAADVYATIEAAISAGATYTDFICVSDQHSRITTTSRVFAGSNTAAVPIISVDDTAADTYKAGAYEEMTAGANKISYTGKIYMKGMHLKSFNSIKPDGHNDYGTFEDCTLEGDFNLDTIGPSGSGDGSGMTLINCTMPGDGKLTGGSGGGLLKWYGGSYSGAADRFIASGGTIGGGTTDIRGVDLSSMTSGYLYLSVGGDSGDDLIQHRMHGCKLSASLTDYVEETPVLNDTVSFLITNSAATSAAAEYQYYYLALGGAVEDETGVYRDATTPWPSGETTSLKCATTATVQKSQPFSFEFPTRYATLSDTATDTLRIYLTSSDTLYDSDVWVEVMYPDGTNKHQYNFLSTQHTEILDTNGTELSTNTESWTSPPTTPKYYHIDVDTSTAGGGDDGADCYPIIRVYVAKASTTIYFDSEVVIA